MLKMLYDSIPSQGELSFHYFTTSLFTAPHIFLKMILFLFKKKKI